MNRNASNLGTLKNDNRALILNEIRKAPIARAQLAALTKLTKSAVTIIVNEMIAEGLLTELELGEAPKGRKPILLDIVADYRFAAGIELHREHISVVITDLKLQVIDSVTMAIGGFQTAEETIDWAVQQIDRLMAKNNIPFKKLLGVGVSSAGPLDCHNGIVLRPTNFQLFHNTPVVSMIGEKIHLPVTLDNVAVTLAMREYFYGSMKRFHGSLFVIVSNGVGSCLVSDGQIYRGFAGYAGEIGHVSIDKNGPPCACGNKGCLELYLEKTVLQKQHGFESFENMVDLAYDGNERAKQALGGIAEALGTAFIGAINLLDIDSIILCGELNYRPELLLRKIREIVEKGSMIGRAHDFTVIASDFSEETSMVASTVVLLDRFFNQNLL